VDPLPADSRLLARYSGKQNIRNQLRLYPDDLTAAVGISTHSVPHQLRRTYAMEMTRAGESLPALMTLRGHVKAGRRIQGSLSVLPAPTATTEARRRNRSPHPALRNPL
jgi:integrase